MIKKKELEFIEKEKEKALKRQNEEYEREKEIRKKKLEELTDIRDSINDYQTKISETSKKLDQMRIDRSNDRIKKASDMVAYAVLMPFTFGLTSIPFVACGESNVKEDLKYRENVRDLEKDLENYKIQISKLRAKEEDIKSNYF